MLPDDFLRLFVFFEAIIVHEESVEIETNVKIGERRDEQGTKDKSALTARAHCTCMEQ